MRPIVIAFLSLFICNLAVAAPLNDSQEHWLQTPKKRSLKNVLLKTLRHGKEFLFSSAKKYKFDKLNPAQMIRKAGYPAQTHIVQTKDGYLLTLHRIPGDNKPPVLLQHGLLSSSADWIIPGKNKSLAFILADQGYDVWLGNFRGNIYSRVHVSLSSSDSEFWDFSFHEMGIYDLPAMISYITNTTSQSLHTYIGHSMGTTTSYVMAAERPDIAQMVQMIISLAPVAFMEHMSSPLRYFANLANKSEIFANFIQFGDKILMQDGVMHFLVKKNCKYLGEKICANLLFQICGFDKEQLDYNLLPLILNYGPAGTSTKTLLHFSQEIYSGKFRQYDYGDTKNQLTYNAIEPPEYNLSKITVPIALFYADNDLLANSLDVKRLHSLLPNVLDMYEVPLPKFSHVDFLWGKGAPKYVYERLINIMKKI